MAQKKLSKIRRTVDRYRRILEETIRVHQVILYGSYAYGTPHEGSDIDLVIISPDFARIPPLKRLEFLSLARKELMEPIEALGYTPKEFKRAKTSILLDEVLERGIVLYQS
jgi:predicted nucleotidyltransferase